MTAGRTGGPSDPADESGLDEETAPEGPTPPTVAAAPTAATPLPGRKRRLVFALVLLLAGAGAVAGVLFLSGGYQQQRELEMEAEAILIKLSEGKADEVYEKASSRFQQTLIIDRFMDLVARMNATLGRFVAATDVNDVDRAVGIAGMTAAVFLDLEYENASTVGRLTFVRGHDGRWLLFGLSVEIPAELVAKADALEAQERRMSAPKEVIELVHSMFEDVRAGRAAEIYERASTPFKSSVTAAGFTGMIQSHQAPLGTFVRVLDVVSSALSPDRYRARVQTVLEYQKGKTTGTFEFMRVDGSWRLAGFKVVIPFGDTMPDEKRR